MQLKSKAKLPCVSQALLPLCIQFKVSQSSLYLYIKLLVNHLNIQNGYLSANHHYIYTFSFMSVNHNFIYTFSFQATNKSFNKALCQPIIIAYIQSVFSQPTCHSAKQNGMSVNHQCIYYIQFYVSQPSSHLYIQLPFN